MEVARSCDLLLGGKRNLEIFAEFPQEKREIGSQIQPLLEFIEANFRTRKTGILVSGDPGLFSLLPVLRRHFQEEVLEVVPGISALQYLFARIKLPWHDAVVLSLHGRREKDLAELVRDNVKVGIFTDHKHTPGMICKLLLEKGIKSRKVYIGENLSYPEEKIYAGSLEDCRELQVEGLNVMVILGGGGERL
jgi:precorrin-6y C5,15-methyltransferase (decarboxylating) CbiE subunit